MNQKSARTAINAVYLGISCTAFAWFPFTYGFGVNASWLACAGFIFYSVLFTVAVFDPRWFRSSTSGVVLSPRLVRIIRIGCLTLPAIALAYIATFYTVQNTYFFLGGHKRYVAFTRVEEHVFGKTKCNIYFPPSVERGLEKYAKQVFQPWVKKHWHPPFHTGTLSASCTFEVEKDGKIVNVAISKNSGSRSFDQAALAALDGIAPPLPVDAPWSIGVVFTFDLNLQKPAKPPVNYSVVELQELGRSYSDRSDYVSANKFLRRCLASCRAQFGDSDPCQIAVLIDLADLYSRMGLLKKSDDYRNQALTLAKSKHGDNYWVAEVLRRCAEESYDRKNYSKAVVQYKEFQAIADPEWLDRKFRVQLAQSLYGCGRYEIALKEFDKILRQDESSAAYLGESVLNEERVAMCSMYFTHKAPQKARLLVDSMLSSPKGKLSGDKYDVRSRLLKSLAEMYQTLKDSEARQMVLEKALVESTDVYGPLAPQSVDLRLQLALLMWERGRKADATGVFAKLVSSCRNGSPDYANALFHQAAFDFEKGRLENAETSLRQVIRIRDKAYGDSDQRTTIAIRGLVTVLNEEGKSVEAAKLESTIQESDRFYFLYDLAEKYRSNGNLSKAIEVHEAYISDLRKRNSPSDQTDCFQLIEQLIDLCREKKDYVRLERYLKEEYEQLSKWHDVPSCKSLFEFYLERNQLAKAEDVCHLEVNDQARQWTKEGSAYSAETLAESFVLLARVCFEQKKVETGKYYLSRAIDAVEPYGRSYVHTESVGLLAQLLAKEGNLKSAETLLKDLLKGELSDTTCMIPNDPVAGFNWGRNCGYQTCITSSYSEPDGALRIDPNIYSLSGTETPSHPPRVIEPNPMIEINWNIGEHNQSDYYFLKASTLTALSSLQERQSVLDECNKNRSMALNIIEKDVLGSEENSSYVDFEQYQTLLKRLPPSTQRNEILRKLDKLRKEDASGWH